MRIASHSAIFIITITFLLTLTLACLKPETEAEAEPFLTSCESQSLELEELEETTLKEQQQLIKEEAKSFKKMASDQQANPTPTRVPPTFISHGSPMLFSQKNEPAHWFLKDFGKQIKKDFPNLRAIVIFSAHWDTEDGIRVNTADSPPQIYDFYGFPKFAYEFKYRPKGNSEVSHRVIELLKAAQIPVKPDPNHGLDHGSWSPLSIAFPQADIPMVQVSLHSSLEPKLHLKIGQALSPLQFENVLLLGSGSVTHNFGHIKWDADSSTEIHSDAAKFEEFLTDIVTNKKGEERFEAFTKIHSNPYTKKAHPSSDHLAPIFIPAAAGANNFAKILHRTFALGGLSMAAFSF